MHLTRVVVYAYILLCISYAAKSCSEMMDFNINFTPVGTEGSFRPLVACCESYPTVKFCVGNTYSYDCIIQSAECALNFTRILRGEGWNNESAMDPKIVLGASEGWVWDLPFLGQNETISGWKLVVTGERQKDMGNEFYPASYTSEYVFSNKSLTAGSIFTMEVVLNTGYHSSPYFALLLLLITWLL